MSTVIGRLRAVLSLDNAQFQKGMNQSQRRMQDFGRGVARAARVASAVVASAGVLAVRSSLRTVDAQAKLAQSLGTTVKSIQVLARAGDMAGLSMAQVEQGTKDLTRRLSQASAGTGPAVAALDRLGLSANELIALPLDERIVAITDAINQFVPEAERAAVMGQVFGEEASILFARMDSKTIRQATEDMRDFGVVVSEQDADQIERTNDAISRLGLIWRGLSNQLAVAAAPALEAVANAMAAVASRTGPLGIAIRGLFDNIGRLAAYAATFAAVLASRWVAGMAAAAFSVRGLATALLVLRGAMIRTGIGALIVGVGELVYQFDRLVSGAGSFGEAMSLLKDFAVEVWERIRMGAAAAGAAATAMFFDLKADAASGVQSAIESVVGFGNTAANTFEGAYEAIKAIWGLLPAAIGDLAFQAANSLVDGVEAMLNGVVSRINGFIGGINQGLEALGSERRISIIPDLDLGEIENRFEGAATAATTAAQTAFDRAFEDNPLTAPDFGLTDAANRARVSANVYRSAARDLAEGALAPLESWQVLRDAVRAAATDASDDVRPLSESLGEVLDPDTPGVPGGGGGGRSPAAQAIAEIGETAVVVEQQVTGAGRAMAEGIIGPLKEAFKSGEMSARTFKDAAIDILENLRNRLIDQIFRPIEDAIARAFSGMGGGGGILGAFVGGLFGGGVNSFAPAGSAASMMSGGLYHSGGIVGHGGPSRLVPANVFAGARRMHSGGIAGGEVPAILKRGEGVFTREQMAAMGHRGEQVTIRLSLSDDLRAEQHSIATKAALVVVDQHDKRMPGVVRHVTSGLGRFKR